MISTFYNFVHNCMHVKKCCYPKGQLGPPFWDPKAICSSPGSLGSYIIFVNFWYTTAPHYLGLSKYSKKCINF